MPAGTTVRESWVTELTVVDPSPATFGVSAAGRQLLELVERRCRPIITSPLQSVEPGGGTMPSSWMIVGTISRNSGAAD